MTDLLPLRSASWKRSSTETGTKTQFSGFGNTPTGELEKYGLYLVASGESEINT